MDEARAIADIIQSSGILCAAGFNWRYSPVVDRARELTRGRLVNLVISAYVTNLALTNGLRDWFYLKELSGGLILDQAIHLVDLMRYLMGEIVEVHTFASNAVRPQSETFTSEDSTTSSLRFASGATGVHVHSWVNPGRSSVIISGADFTLDINAWSPPQLRGTFPGPGRQAGAHRGGFHGRTFCGRRPCRTSATAARAHPLSRDAGVPRGGAHG